MNFNAHDLLTTVMTRPLNKLSVLKNLKQQLFRNTITNINRRQFQPTHNQELFILSELNKYIRLTILKNFIQIWLKKSWIVRKIH